MASRLVGDMSGSALDDPLSDRYKKLGCSVSALEKESDDYRMIMKYLETTYEPVRVGDMVRLHILLSLNAINSDQYHVIKFTVFYLLM